MKKIISLFFVISVLLTGCSDPHKYNEETDKQCLKDIEEKRNPSQTLLKALKGDASPKIIEQLLDLGAQPNITVGKDKVPIISYAKSPKAIYIIYKEIKENLSIESKSGKTPLFYYETPELCKAYIDAVVDHTEMGTYQNPLTQKIIQITPQTVMKQLLTHKDDYKRSPLFYAKNKELIDYWISMGCDLNAPDQYGKNVLIYQLADKSYSDENIKYLIEQKANVNFNEGKGKLTPLAVALSSNRSKDIVNLLISKGAKLENYNNTSNFYFHVNTPEQVEFLKSKNLSPDIETTNGLRIKIPAIKSNNVEISEDESCVVKSPLAKAVVKNNLELTKALLKAGANPVNSYAIIDNAFSTKVSVLRYSITINKNKEIRDLLIEHGALKTFDANKIIEDLLSETPEKLDSALICLLLKNNFNLLKNEEIKNALKSAQGLDLSLAIEALKEDKNLDPAATEELFLFFFQQNDIPSLLKMISYGFNINQKSSNGTILREKILAKDELEYTNKNFLHNLELLLKLGLDVNDKDSKGKTLFDLLLSSSDDINIKDMYIDTWKTIIDKTKNLNGSYINEYTEEKETSISRLLELKIDVNVIEYFLSKGGSTSTAKGHNILWDILDNPFRNKSEDLIITIINHSTDLDTKLNKKPILIHVLDGNRAVSIKVIEALAKKLKNPHEACYVDSIFQGDEPDQITPIKKAKSINRPDIVKFLESLK